MEISSTDQKNSNSLSVSHALNLAKGALEAINVTILGEVSEVNNKAGYKAVYFTIKDDNSSLPCMIWLSRYSALGIDLKVGALVHVTGRFSLYAKKGRMSFDAFNIKYAGEGELRARVAKLAQKLQAQGLMDASKKRALPQYPESIGVVTSPRGAAVHDVLRTLRRRYPIARVVLAGVPVEGATAAAGMATALLDVAAAGVEVVLLVRGGGSFEDLMPFNDEALARTVAAMPMPVVTGIGHEPDNSIADMVADLRASTPTAAAEAVSPNMSDLEQNVRSSAQHMHSQFAGRLQKTALILKGLADAPVLRDPNALLAGWNLEMDEAVRCLEVSLRGVVPDRARGLSALVSSLALSLPREVNAQSQNLALLEQKIATRLPACTQAAGAALAASAGALNALSPLATLGRGYSITRGAGGEILKDAAQVSAGDEISITLGAGEIDARVLGARDVTYYMTQA